MRGPAGWRASQQIQPQGSGGNQFYERRAKVLPPVSEHPLCANGTVRAWGGRLELGRILYDTLFGLAPNVQPLFKRPRDAIAIKCAARGEPSELRCRSWPGSALVLSLFPRQPECATAQGGITPAPGAAGSSR